MRKPGAILLFALLGLNSFGLFFFFWGEIQLCKIQAVDDSGTQFTLPAASCTLFTSGDSHFTKINSHEILSEGKLYDIVRTRVQDGKKVYLTFHDAREDSFTRQLSLWGKSNSQDNSLPGRTLVIQLVKYYQTNPSLACGSLKAEALRQIQGLRNEFLYESPTLQVDCPPPIPSFC